MAGVAAMLRWGPSLGIVPVLAVVALALGLWRRPKATVAALVLLAFGLGMVRAATHQSVQPPSIDTFEQGIEVHLTGRIVRPPDIEKRRPLTLDIRSADPVYAGSDSSRAVGGRVDVFSFSPLYSEGQELDVSGDTPALRPAASRSQAIPHRPDRPPRRRDPSRLRRRRDRPAGRSPQSRRPSHQAGATRTSRRFSRRFCSEYGPKSRAR